MGIAAIALNIGFGILLAREYEEGVLLTLFCAAMNYIAIPLIILFLENIIPLLILIVVGIIIIIGLVIGLGESGGSSAGESSVSRTESREPSSSRNTTSKKAEPEKTQERKANSSYIENYNEVGGICLHKVKHVKLPLMFRRGDIVHIIGTELYGIVDAPENDEEEEQYITVAEKGDYSDFQVPVNLMYEGQKFLSVFSHEHCAPTDIEYARLDEQDNRKGFLEYMKKTLYEKSFVTGPGRDKERFDEILSKLEKVWNQYPDLRLGQLLVIVCGKSDLFMIEDEELLERLQYNQFPIE